MDSIPLTVNHLGFNHSINQRRITVRYRRDFTFNIVFGFSVIEITSILKKKLIHSFCNDYACVILIPLMTYRIM